jgi:hypothetical protein
MSPQLRALVSVLVALAGAVLLAHLAAIEALAK